MWGALIAGAGGGKVRRYPHLPYLPDDQPAQIGYIPYFRYGVARIALIATLSFP